MLQLQLKVKGDSQLLYLLQGLRAFLPVFSLIYLLCFPAAQAANSAVQRDDAANRIVSGIISFSHWPQLTQPPQLCVFASAQHLAQPKGPTPFSVVWINQTSELSRQRCDAIYFGDQTPQQQTELLAMLQGKSVLSIAENNPDCAVGAAFCLIFNRDHTAFSVNLDSLARSGVRVSPDVLLLSRKGSK